MVRFESLGGAVIYVNPSLVRTAWKAKTSDGKEGIQLDFSDDEYWMVKGTIEEVVSALNGTPPNFGVPSLAGETP